MMKRILSALIVLLLLSALTLTAFAAETLDPSRRGSISITMIYRGDRVPGGTMTLYRVAELDGAAFQYTEEFQDCEIPLDDLSNPRLAEELARMVRMNSLEGTTNRINNRGNVSFTDLEIGVYLLVQRDAAPGYNRISPFLVSVPGRENDSYIYDVNASPKIELEPKPTKPTEPPTESTTPPGDKLPQTGQNNWPVPALASGGLLLIGLGLCLRSNSKKKAHEE